jgi:hypothetical protein
MLPERLLFVTPALMPHRRNATRVGTYVHHEVRLCHCMRSCFFLHWYNSREHQSLVLKADNLQSFDGKVRLDFCKN